MNRAVEFWQEFFNGKDGAITMCIENQFEGDCEIIKMELDALNDPRLKVCLDIGHSNANSSAAAEEWIASLADRIAYLHLHNNHGRQNIKGRNNDEHLELDNGTMDMKKVLESAERYCPNAIWNIETAVDRMGKSIEYLKELHYL